MNISLDRLAVTIDVLEMTKGVTFDEAIRHTGKIHAIKILSSSAVLSAAEKELIDGAMERAEHFVDSFIDEIDEGTV